MSRHERRSSTMFTSPVGLGLLCVAVSPLGLVLIRVTVERRPFDLGEQYLAFLVGDVFIALGVAAAAWSGHRVPLTTWHVLVPVVAALTFGAIQMGGELSRGVYSPGQAWSPTHLYHQFVVYPVLAVFVLRAILMAVGDWRAVVSLVVCASVWAGLLVWDHHHPKSPHDDFSWPWQSSDTRSTP